MLVCSCGGHGAEVRGAGDAAKHRDAEGLPGNGGDGPAIWRARRANLLRRAPGTPTSTARAWSTPWQQAAHRPDGTTGWAGTTRPNQRPAPPESPVTRY